MRRCPSLFLPGGPLSCSWERGQIFPPWHQLQVMNVHLPGEEWLRVSTTPSPPTPAHPQSFLLALLWGAKSSGTEKEEAEV